MVQEIYQTMERQGKQLEALQKKVENYDKLKQKNAQLVERIAKLETDALKKDQEIAKLKQQGGEHHSAKLPAETKDKQSTHSQVVSFTGPLAESQIKKAEKPIGAGSGAPSQEEILARFVDLKNGERGKPKQGR